MTTVYSTDRSILEQATQWLDAGHRVVLVTVVKTWGSSPRPRGSLMLIRDDGLHEGSVSGGCVEEDLLARLKNDELADQYPTLVDYGVDRQEAMRFGLPCGGRLELLIEQLDSAAPLQSLLKAITSGNLVKRRVCLNTGEVSLHPAKAADDFAYTQDFVQKIFGPSWQLLLIGAGHLSRYVAQIALMLDYGVTVCDPREEYRQGWDMEGVDFSHAMPDDAVTALADHPRGIVVALTHDPKLDDMALMEALNSNAFYVGALGSKLSSKKRRERLLELGVSSQALTRLHAPVGLSIGSHTPPEIAVSIMAEITAVRHKAV
jgi:xanthine dehydrogenase accessory factor